MKKTIYWVLTLLFPLVFLALVEFSLRLGGYNEPAQELFIEVPAHREYLTVNPDFVSRYFPNFQPQMGVAHFLKEKPENTFRVFVMGGSSAQGFPYNFHTSFSSQLEERLLMETRDLNIEVINLGMTAVNSYVIRDLSRRLSPHAPDAILIYAGHNEYYGSFGVGSTQFGFGEAVWLKRLIIYLKNWRLYQFLENMMKPEDQGESENRTMMAKVVREAEIQKGGELFEAGIRQFRENISDVLAYFEEESVPVFIGTVASNLKDQPPLGANEKALNAYKEAEKLFREKRVAIARTVYREAKELDEIRFRAPEKINEVIREEARKYGAEVLPVDILAAEHSRSSVPDSSFFADHLHPDWEGHQLMADLFFDRMVQSIDRLDQAYAPNVLFRRSPLSRFEKIYSSVPVERLTAGYPFQKGLTEEAEYENFRDRYEAHLHRSYIDSIAATAWRTRRQVSLALTDVVNYSSRRGDSLSVMQHYKQLAYWQIYNDRILEKGVRYALSNRKYDPYTAMMLHLILRIPRENPFFANSLATLYLIHRDLERAEGWLAAAKELDAESPLLWYNYTALYSMKGDSARAGEAFQKYLNIRDNK